MNTAIVIFILVLFCILLAALYLRQRNNTVEKRQSKSNECIVRAI
jgi:heme/copper-type cytochrome/quinol oxidase subunit 2